MLVAISILSDGALQCLSLRSHRLTVQSFHKPLQSGKHADDGGSGLEPFTFITSCISRTVKYKMDEMTFNLAEFPFMCLSSEVDRGHVKLQPCSCLSQGHLGLKGKRFRSEAVDTSRVCRVIPPQIHQFDAQAITSACPSHRTLASFLTAAPSFHSVTLQGLFFSSPEGHSLGKTGM